MRRLILCLLSFCLLWLCWDVVHAQSGGDVSITFTLAEKEPTVGDLLNLTLEVRHPAGWQVIVPQARQAWQDSAFEVRDQSPVKVKPNSDGSQTTQVTVTAVLYAPGKYQTPPWTLTVNPAGGKPFERPVPRTSVEIKSVLEEGQRDLRDIKPQADLATPPLWLLIAAAVLILAALAGLVWWFISRRRSRKGRATAAAGLDTTPPWQAALDELTRIDGLGLLETDDFKHFYSLIADCLRLYLEKQWKVAALDRTTAEIRRDVRGSALAPAQVNVLLELLTEADLVKFAKFIPDVPSAQSVMARARAFVEAVKPNVPAL